MFFVRAGAKRVRPAATMAIAFVIAIAIAIVIIFLLRGHDAQRNGGVGAQRAVGNGIGNAVDAGESRLWKIRVVPLGVLHQPTPSGQGQTQRQRIAVHVTDQGRKVEDDPPALGKGIARVARGRRVVDRQNGDRQAGLAARGRCVGLFRRRGDHP